MKRRTRITAFILFIVLCAGIFAGCSRENAGTPDDAASSPADTAEKEPRSTLRFPEKDRYHYDMELTLDNRNQTVGGHVVFDFYNDSEDSWDKLCMRDYPSLYTDPDNLGYDEDSVLATELKGGKQTEITNIIDGRDGSSLEYKRDKDVSVIWLELAKPLAPNEKMTLEYDFVTTIPSGPDRFGFIYTPYDYFNVTHFYPILAEYADGEWSHAGFIAVGECFYSETADYDVRLTVPKSHTVAATGIQTAKQENENTVTYTYNAPCVRDFVFCASDDFVCESRVFDGVNVNVVYREHSDIEDMKPCVETAFMAAENSLDVFGRVLGVYPYDELDIVISPYHGSGMEYPTLILMGEMNCAETYILDENKEIARGTDHRAFEIVISHEIGHQWFMGIVGSNSGVEPWQDESLTSYLELVYWDNVHDGDYSDVGMAPLPRTKTELSNEKDVEKLKKKNQLPIDRAYVDFGKDFAYQEGVYTVGQRVFDEMEQILGREEMYSLLREYVHENAFTNAFPSDFFKVLYAHAGTDNEKLNELIATAFSADVQPANFA